MEQRVHREDLLTAALTAGRQDDRKPGRSKNWIQGIIVSMATIYISEADAARDFAGLMARVRAGAEIVIESDTYPAAVLRAAEPLRRSISECIALAKKQEEQTGEAPVLDSEFAADVEEIINNRKPWNPPAWD
jgi:antitoxin (DNA-binding transcriptional repressor) of toxin-antitoxin stability system